MTYLGPGAAGTLAILLGLAVMGFCRYRLQDEDLTALQHQIERQVHADWISKGSLEGIDPDRQISVESLVDLVDVAIDTDTRVIHDPEYDVFAVVDEAAVYYYAQSANEEWQANLFGQ